MAGGPSQSLAQEFQQTGRLWFRRAVSSDDLAALDAYVVDGRPGRRVASSRDVHDTLVGALCPVLNPIARDLVPVRIVAFAKAETMNWGVPWHQDRVIAVAERHDVAGYSNWTIKSGIWHCEPPTGVLDQMIFARVHLDAAEADDGAMQIALGSHTFGIVAGTEAATVAAACPVEACVAEPGDVLALHMLTLHASAPSITGRPRRVLRVDLAPPDLIPLPLAWSRA